VSKIQFIPGHESKLVSGGNDRFLLVWDYVSGTVLQKVDIPSLVKDVNPVVSMAFYKSVFVLALEKTDNIQVWSVTDEGVLSFEHTLSIPSNERVFDMAFDSMGSLWLSGLSGVYYIASLSKNAKQDEWNAVSSLSQVSPLSKGYAMEDIVEYRKRATQWTEEKKEEHEKSKNKKRKRGTQESPVASQTKAIKESSEETAVAEAVAVAAAEAAAEALA
jgi:WD40 repeat protein